MTNGLFSLFRVQHQTFISKSSRFCLISNANRHSHVNLHKIASMNLHFNRKNANARRNIRVEKQFSFFCGFNKFYIAKFNINSTKFTSTFDVENAITSLDAVVFSIPNFNPHMARRHINYAQRLMYA